MEALQDPAVWVAISFTIFAVFAFIKGRHALLGKLDGHIAAVRREIDTAESLRLEAQKLLDEYSKKQRDAAQEAKAIVENAQNHADRIRKQAEIDLSEAAKRREQQLRDRLDRMEETALSEIRAYAAELAVKATREIIADKMDDKTNARLVDESVRQVAGQLR